MLGRAVFLPSKGGHDRKHLRNRATEDLITTVHSRVLPIKSKLIFMCRISELPPFKPQISSMASNWK